MIRKIVLVLKVIATIRNWQEYAFLILGLPPRDDFIRLRNGISYKIRKNDVDKLVIGEVWAAGNYTQIGRAHV